jgi:hypothetical protein
MTTLRTADSSACGRAQPVAGFCHHAPRSTQVVAFRLRLAGLVAYKFAGEGAALRH